MFSRKKSKYQLMLEGELEKALRNLKSCTVGSEEYVKTLSYAERLHEMIEKPSSVSKDTLANIAANLLGIAMILRREWVGPVTSKALSFVTRLR